MPTFMPVNGSLVLLPLLPSTSSSTGADKVGQKILISTSSLLLTPTDSRILIPRTVYGEKLGHPEPRAWGLMQIVTLISIGERPVLPATLALGPTPDQDYSQFILIPFGHNNKPIPQFDAYMDLGRRIRQATAARYGTNYTVGNWFNLLYRSMGCSVDWVKRTYNTNLTLTYEMRDTGRYGFLLPAEQIIPSAEEFLDGFAVVIAKLRAGIVTPDLPPDVLQANPNRTQSG
ncbi:unnamed protein product, partial [Allacma fusca]